MVCKVIGTVCFKLGESKPIGFDLTKYCINYWKGGERQSIGEVVRPREVANGGKGPNGYEYRVTTAGQTAEKEPSWPTTVGSTVVNGSVTFTCQAISNDSLWCTIQSSVWEPPTGVSASGESIQNTNGEQKTAAFLDATALVSSDQVVNEVTFVDALSNEFVDSFALKISVR